MSSVYLVRTIYDDFVIFIIIIFFFVVLLLLIYKYGVDCGHNNI